MNLKIQPLRRLPSGWHPPLLLPSFLRQPRSRPRVPGPSYAPAIRQIIRGYVLLFLLRAAKDFLGMAESATRYLKSFAKAGQKPSSGPGVAYKYTVKMQNENTGQKAFVARFDCSEWPGRLQLTKQRRSDNDLSGNSLYLQ